MRRLPPLSPDVIAPGQPKRKSRAHTPSGKGRGHTDDEQTYRRAARLAGRDDSEPPDVLIRSAAKAARLFISWNAGRWAKGNRPEVQRAITALDELVDWLNKGAL